MKYYLINIIGQLFYIYNIIILLRVFLSWVNPDPYNPIVRFIYDITEPVLRPFRVILRTGSIGFDFSPIIAFIVLSIIRDLLIKFLNAAL